MEEEQYEAVPMEAPQPEAGGAAQDDDARDTHKFGLPFILNVPIRRRHGPRRQAALASVAVAAPRPSVPTTPELSKEEKKLCRTCKEEGCANYIVHKGLCCRHGGGKKCTLTGCTTSAKHGGLCWKHGGSVGCKQDGRSRKAKARGLCWAHGGGTRCQSPDCSKVAVSNGCCWAHGGGKRCGFDGCVKPAYTRTHNLCEKHYRELRRVTYFEV